MKTCKELHEIIKAFKFNEINAHVHTHLCDGRPEMTVENIAGKAEETGLKLIILVPHFHKQVSDETATLYADSSEDMFLKLREEIDRYEAEGGTVKFLLSSEADILSVDGEISLHPSPETEKAMDLVTPTINYHPLLPLEFVSVTHLREVDQVHESGRFAKAAEAVGGVANVIKTAFEAETNAIRRCPYPAMVGHFFAAYCISTDTSSWFGARIDDIPDMMRYSEELLSVCKKTDAMIDITGMHLRNGRSVEEARVKNGYFYDFQSWFLSRCDAEGVIYCPGSDAHGLLLDGAGFYSEYFRR